MVNVYLFEGEAPDLGLRFPPYHFDISFLTNKVLKGMTSAEEEEVFLRRLDARQYACMIAAVRERHKAWTLETYDDTYLAATVQDEVDLRIAAWYRLKEQEEAELVNDIKEIALEWNARLICTLVEEWQCRRKGWKVYYDAHRAQELPWQKADRTEGYI